MTTLIAGDDVYAIAEELFTAMVDGESGTVSQWFGDVPAWQVPVVAWVDLHGGWAGRASVTTERATADDLARALLQMGADEPVLEEDLHDAFGEVANVVGGNVKALLPTQGTLGLPQVADHDPGLPGSVLVTEVVLDWRGRPLVLRVRGAA
ncbi:MULTISPECIES: chemotaxis protein CheX [Cellulomonas]|jgi:hypothetical protein|uniref:Chemotaxis phosphatase CheX-like domain-containing protein n=1 Tax=Cellulomonas iranensis TaxID=76862 RepID=A0ABU0GJD0_9CELL|nr:MULTISPECIES: chemotaxis protein CheX [Cellulomonas]MBO9570350.1 chemotaxis protein CheX [Cellulomonas iranensis]MDQ0424657.1 hypothetical protein [Cellulomonas iranensis]